MKVYFCKFKGCIFTGTRQEVREHIREYHWVKSTKKLHIGMSGGSGRDYQSPITDKLGSLEI